MKIARTSDKKFSATSANFYFSILILGLLLILAILLGMSIQTGVRSSIHAASSWSNAQKDAVIAIAAYIGTGDTEKFAEFEQSIKIQNFGRLARLEIEKDSPDYRVLDHYLIHVGSHPNDVRNMGYLFGYGKAFHVIRRSLQIWEEADHMFAELLDIVFQHHAKRLTSLENGSSSDADLLHNIYRINGELTLMESEFSSQLESIGRTVSNMIFATMTISFIFVFGYIALLFGRVESARQRALREKTKFKVLIDGLNTAAIVSITDRAGRISYVNDKFCQVSGYSAAELVGFDHRIINSSYHPKIFFKHLWETIVAGDVWSGEICNRRKDGELYWVNSTIVPMHDENGKRAFLSIRFDITDRKNLEDERNHASKMASLGQMASGIAHEINNPLTIIAGRCRSLKRKIASDTSNAQILGENIESIVETTNRVAKIIAGLQAFARDGSQLPLELTTVSTPVSDAIDLCKGRFEKGYVDLQVGPLPDATALCRPVEITQILVNLLNNAYDAALETPEKWVRLEMCLAGANRLQISVEDSGGGIPSKYVEKLTQPFFTTKEVGKGTGLGLSISVGLAQRNGGSLKLDQNHPNTRFVLELPLTQQATLNQVS